MKTTIKNTYCSWLAYYKPDYVSELIITKLVMEYINNDSLLLFKKMNQLTQDEHYSLCAMFKNLFDYLNINTQYLNWLREENKS